MTPHEIAVRTTEKWWGWRERLSVLRNQAGNSVARGEVGTQLALDEFRLRPFHLFTPASNRAALADAFHGFFPGRVDAIQNAADLICRGSVSLFGQPVQFPQAPGLDWHRDWETGKYWPLSFYRDIDTLSPEEGVDVKRVWETNRQQFLVTLGKTYFLTSKPAYAQCALALMRSWMEANPPYRGVNWKEGLEAGLRLLSWIWTLRLIADECASDPESLQAILKSLALQRDHVERHLSLYSSPNTHLLGEAVGLVAVGLVLPELPSAQPGAMKALRILEQELDRQVADDGSHREKSAYYHCYALEMYLLVTILGAQRGVSFTSRWMKRVETMAEFLLHMLRPDGSLARFGDDDGGKTLRLADEDYYQPRSLLGVAAVLFSRGDLKHAAGELPEEVFWLCGPEGARRYRDLPSLEPQDRSRWFPEAQVGVLRGGWHRNDLWCVCQQDPMGMLTAGHSHASLLSFELSMDGKLLLIDPGTYSYAAAGPWRDHFRSLEAHNSLQIAKNDWYRKAGPFRWDHRNAVKPLPVTDANRDGLQLGYTADKVSEELRHVRTYRIESDHGLTIEDALEGTGSKPLTLWLHFAPGCRLEKLGEYEFAIQHDKTMIRLLFGGFLRPRYQMWEGSENPLAGWFSPRFGCRIPAPVLCVIEEATLPVSRSMRFQVVHSQANPQREERAETK